MADALDRLKQRQRPKVAPRDASLTSRPQDTQTSKLQGTQMPEPQDMQASRYQDIQMSRDIDAGSPEVELDAVEALGVSEPNPTDGQASTKPDEPMKTYGHTDVYMSRHIENDLPTKRSTFRLDADLIDRLHAFCRRQGLSREVLIEAMYEYMEAHPEALDQVVEQAGRKHEHRQQLANRKRAEAMISKFGRDA